MSNQILLDQIFTMVEATKKKPKKARTYTEEQKQVLVDRLKKAREKKAEKTNKSKPSPQEPTPEPTPVQKSEPAPKPLPKQEAKIEKVEQQIEIESKKADPNNDMLVKLMEKLNKLEYNLESRLTESVKPVKQPVENKPSTLPPTPQKLMPPIPKPQSVIRDYIGLRCL